MPAKLNKEWHEANPMPRNATLEQRYAWHLEHEKVCGCRPMPPRLREQMQARGKEG
ncbi:MAG TPA: hypothetical protein VG845_04965 [Dehalococcoidia bacterium]|jgi:hypothetical protein|nr:hypothetical protein [Dehalococcoidia bacterium]